MASMFGARVVFLVSLLSCIPAGRALGAEPETAAEDPRRSIAVNLGLLQPIVLRGGNIEADFRWDWVVVNYSHGWSLDIPVSGEAKKQHLREFIPFSTGFGAGVQYYFESLGLFTDLRAEFKYHRFELAVEKDDSRRALADYDTITVGAGLYATWLPFAHFASAARGLNAGLSVRAWPRVWSSLEGDRLEYWNEATGQIEVHRTADIGIANSPIIVNLSIGYLFSL
jgi:hypothetical protein